MRLRPLACLVWDALGEAWARLTKIGDQASNSWRRVASCPSPFPPFALDSNRESTQALSIFQKSACGWRGLDACARQASHACLCLWPPSSLCLLGPGPSRRDACFTCVAHPCGFIKPFLYALTFSYLLPASDHAHAKPRPAPRTPWPGLATRRTPLCGLWAGGWDWSGPCPGTIP